MYSCLVCFFSSLLGNPPPEEAEQSAQRAAEAAEDSDSKNTVKMEEQIYVLQPGSGVEHREVEC